VGAEICLTDSRERERERERESEDALESMKRGVSRRGIKRNENYLNVFLKNDLLS